MSTALLPEVDKQLLAAVQVEVPLSVRPYAEIAEQLELPQSLVLDRLRELRSGPHGIIRQISAIFDSGSLGYRSTLVAAKVAEDHLATAAAVINQHPGVSHNYRRDYEYNLWYTLAVAPNSRLNLEETARVLHYRSGAIATRLLPTLKLYKIGVKLDLGERKTAAAPKASTAVHEAQPTAPLTPREIDFIHVLQRDLPIIERPFDAAAAEVGATVEELLAAAERFRARRIMRRFSAVLRHRELGFDANSMGVWIVPPDKQDTFGATAATFPEVSHCYLRPSYPDWPYNIFTMIHTQDRQKATKVLGSIATATGIHEYSALYSTHEFKKVRVQYFTGDAQTWEAGVNADEQERRNGSP
jgi:DNA-binding Lrp family transcriptional regulator